MLLATTSSTLHLAQRKRWRFRRFLSRAWFVSKCLVGAALCTALIWGGSVVYRLVRDAEYFRLRVVQITGNETLTRQDVLYMLALPSNGTLFQLDLSRMGTRLKRHPYVKMVTLRRRFPDTLTVVVQERSPYLAVVSGWQRMILGAEGVVLRRYAPARDRQLPEFRLRHKRALTPGMHLRQKEVQRALELVRAYKSSPVAAMIQLVSFTVEKSGASVWEIEPYAFGIRVGEGEIEAQLERLPSVLQYVVQRDIAVRLVDVSYRKRVIVTLVAS